MIIFKKLFSFFRGRSDLAYLSMQTLNQYAKAYRIQMDAINKALNSYQKESTHYPCLHCKNKGKVKTFISV